MGSCNVYVVRNLYIGPPFFPPSQKKKKQLGCKSCNKTHVGQPKKLLSIRRDERKNNFNLTNKKYHNVISKNRTENIDEDGKPHEFDWNNIQMLRKENNLYKHLFAEMVFIKK